LVAGLLPSPHQLLSARPGHTPFRQEHAQDGSRPDETKEAAMRWRILGCAAGMGLVAFLAWATAPQAPAADSTLGKPRPRKLLYPADPRDLPPVLAPFVARLVSADQPPVAGKALRPTGVFLRIVSRRYVLDGGKLREGAWLGARPFVFLTLPEAGYGRSLLHVFAAIGYSAEEVLTREVGVEKVALVFAYPDDICLHEGRGGRLPETWQRRVFPATWDNLFALTDRLVTSKGYVEIRADNPFTPTRVLLRSEKERLFLASYPDSGRQRVKRSPYPVLRAAGGADWEYRALLERLLGASEHFKGNGRTKLTFGPKGKGEGGFPEFLGPNARLADLRRLAVIGLGTLAVSE
jgi:hypothetical protein